MQSSTMHVSETDKMSEKPEENPVGNDIDESNAEPKPDESVVVNAPKDKLNNASGNNNNSYYIKKRIIAAINRSFKSSSKSITHTFATTDDEKNNSVKNHQPITIIVKGIDLDKELIMYTQEKGIPDIVNLDLFNIKEIPNGHNLSKHRNSHHSSSDRKHSSDERTRHHSCSNSSAAKASSSDKQQSTTPSSSHHRSASDKKRMSHRISDETLKGPYLVCHGCGRKEEKKWLHENNCKQKCCRSTAYVCDSCVRHKLIRNDNYNDAVRHVPYGKYMYVVKCPIGRGCSLHMDYDRITHLRSAEQREVAAEFLKQAFKEDDQGFAQYTIAIVHNGARYMPDILKLMAKTYPNLKVNTTKLKSSTETELTDLLSYYKKVKETYNNGTYAHDPLNETQAACVKNADEYGAYLPELLSLLEKSPFLSQVLPWGELTTKRFKTPHESDDGPIFWCRPGEQIISLDRNCQRNRWNSSEIESFLEERKKNMNVSEKKLIVEELKKYRRSNSTREVLFEDRTRPHADQAWGNNFEATAAVGVIQAIHPDERPDFNRICKEIIVFQAKHIEMLEALLHIDFTAAPKQQCVEWLDDAKLNMIRQMKIEFSKTHLRDNDIYFIPRKIVHQFQTTSATLSIAWHTRLKEYYKENPAADAESSSTCADLPSSAVAAQKTPKKKASSRCPSPESRTPQPRSRHSSKTPKKTRRSRSASVGSPSSRSCKKSKRSRSRENSRKSKTPKKPATETVTSPSNNAPKLDSPHRVSQSPVETPKKKHRSRSPLSERSQVLNKTPKKDAKNEHIDDKKRAQETKKNGDNSTTTTTTPKKEPKKEKSDSDRENVKNGQQAKKRKTTDEPSSRDDRKKPKDEPGAGGDAESPIANKKMSSLRVEIVDIASRFQSGGDGDVCLCDQGVPIKVKRESGEDETSTKLSGDDGDKMARNVDRDDDETAEKISTK